MIDPKNSGTSISVDEMIDILDNIELIPEEEAIAFLDGLLESDKEEK